RERPRQEYSTEVDNSGDGNLLRGRKPGPAATTAKPNCTAAIIIEDCGGFSMPALILFAGTIWQHIFDIGAPLSEKILLPVIVYVFLVLLLRIFGKRELAQLNPFDLVVLLSLSNTVQNAIIGDDNSVTGGLLGAVTLLSINYLVVRFLFKHRRL